MACAEVEDAVDSVQPQSVEVIVLQPVQCVLDKEPSHFVAVLTIEIDRLSPRSSIAIGKVRSECTQVVAFRTEVVVDDVERDRQTLRVSCIDETLQRRRAAVGILRRK